MKDPRFGRNGEPPTEFEERLLAENDRLDEVWATVGKRIGAKALFELFDELNGLIVSVPTRETFVYRLHLPARDQEILTLAEQGMTTLAIAKRYEIQPQTVHDARKRALRSRGKVR